MLEFIRFALNLLQKLVFNPQITENTPCNQEGGCLLEWAVPEIVAYVQGAQFPDCVQKHQFVVSHAPDCYVSWKIGFLADL